MQPGGTRQAVLVATALVASAVLAAWWWSPARQPAAPKAFPKAAQSEIAHRGDDVAAREPAALPAARIASTPEPVPSTAVAPAAAPPETKPAPLPDAGGTSGTPSPSPDSKVDEDTRVDDAQPTPSIAEEPAPGDDGAPDAHAREDSAADSANPDAEKSENGEAQTGEASDAEAAADAAPGSAVDADRVADLYAHLFETTESSDDQVDAHEKQELRDFDAREAGGENERDLERTLRERFGEWMATLPAELAPHVLLASVDCHVGQCRVLLAQNAADFSVSASQESGSAINAMQSAIWSFLGGGLMDELHLRLISSSRSAASSAQQGPPDTALWVLLLEVGDSQAAPSAS